ncbi:MYB-like transcription factor ETC3 isoform X2 [Impatiens glandulifera]|uniref:MYB-like transcription factor ETC3 isoform X2 n=1 Tax=Impatiens glandulifera TaxID=253017 RepID=UPI001FB1313E|nr:MYB-like transcription factor ETC3 isoform X2 [Impatiens glandulifera]
MGSRRWKKAKTSNHCYSEEEVSSIAWQFLDMSEQEEDMVYRMHRLVGESWADSGEEGGGDREILADETRRRPCRRKYYSQK